MRNCGHRRRCRSVARIPRSLLTRERATRLFGFSLTYVLEKPVPVSPPVQRDVYGPRLRKNLRVFDGRLVLNRVAAGHAVSLDDVQRVAVKVSRHVEPGFVIVVADVDNQRVSVPMASRITHPGIEIGGVRTAVCVDQAIVQGPLEGHRNLPGCLEDLKREIQIHDPRHAGNVALVKRIGLLPILKVLGFLRSGPWLIRDFGAYDNRPAGQHVVTGGVILEIGGRRTGRLPNAFEVWLAIGRARQSLSGSRRALRKSDERAYQGDGRDRSQTVRRHTRVIFTNSTWSEG